MFFCELFEILQNSFFKEHAWPAASDLGKYLKTLAIIIAFSEYNWIWHLLKPCLEHYIV